MCCGYARLRAVSCAVYFKAGVVVFQSSRFLGRMIEFVVRVGRLRGGGERSGAGRGEAARAPARLRGDTGWAVARAASAWQLGECPEGMVCGLRFSTRSPDPGCGPSGQAWVRNQCARLLPCGVKGGRRDGGQVRPVKWRVFRGTGPKTKIQRTYPGLSP